MSQNSAVFITTHLGLMLILFYYTLCKETVRCLGCGSVYAFRGQKHYEIRRKYEKYNFMCNNCKYILRRL